MEENITDLNRVELRGRVGQEPRIFTSGENQVAKFSLATSETFHDRKGDIKEETTWHNVAAWNGKDTVNVKQIRKGALIHLTGRLRNVKYTSVEGEERHFTEIVATRLEILKGFPS